MSEKTNADSSDFPNKDAPSPEGGSKEAAANASLSSLEQWVDMVEETSGAGSGIPAGDADQPLLERARALEARIETLEVAAAARERERYRPLRRLMFRFVLAAVLLAPYYWLYVAFDRLATERENAAAFWTLAGGDGYEEIEEHERVSAFLDLAHRGHREWRSAKLRELDLKGAQLRGTSLPWARFQSCTLKSARFDNADLSYATFNQSDLQGSVLAGARMHETFFQVCNLTAVDGRGGDFSGARLQAQLSGGKFQDANFTRARLRGSRCVGVRFDRAKFIDADLSGVDLGRCVFTDTDFRGAALDGARFTDANWWRAKGLTAEQVTRYSKEFAPTEKASAALRTDFEAWKKTVQR